MKGPIMADSRGRTSERVADILGMSNAHTILRALDDGGESAQVARDTIRNVDDQTRLKFALVEICHAMDRTEEKRADDRAAFDELQTAHDKAMSGQGQSCRFIVELGNSVKERIDALETRFLRYVLAVLILPLVLWGMMEFIAWRVRAYSQPQKGGVTTYDTGAETRSP